MQPPLLPEETLARVYRLARIDGTGVLLLAGAFALAAAIVGDRTGAIIGLLVAGAGAIELHGTQLLRHGEIQAMRWLIFSQLCLMLVVLAYCVIRLVNFSPEFINHALTPELRAAFVQAGYAPEELNGLVRRIYYLTYALVAAGTVIYQGAMIRFYLRRWTPVAQALAAAEEE